jgi:SAM-dependent methyltransferase
LTDGTAGLEHIGVTPDEIDRVFAPYVRTEGEVGDRKYTKEVARLYAEMDDVRWGEGKNFERPVEDPLRVSQGYDRLWSSMSLAGWLASEKAVWFEWGSRALRARTIGRKHVHLLLLVRALERLAPHTVLEVGSGNGFNLLSLSMQFPEVRFLGVELTHGGARAAMAAVRDPRGRTGPLLAPLAFRPVGRPPTVHVSQGSAVTLPLPDRSVDVSLTVVALEQMRPIQETALRELARVTRHAVVMIEPFAEWNHGGLQRRYIDRLNYFNASLRDLPSLGLHLTVVSADLPNKMLMHVGLVIARVG